MLGAPARRASRDAVALDIQLILRMVPTDLGGYLSPQNYSSRLRLQRRADRAVEATSFRMHTLKRMNGSPFTRAAANAFVVACVTGFAWGCWQELGRIVSLVPTEMQRTGPLIGDTGGTVTFWGNGTLRSDVHVEKGPVNISIVARGTNSGGEWPQVHIALASRIIASVSVDSAVPREYTIQVQLPGAETGVLDIALVNYVAVAGRPLAGRNLLVQKITLRQ